MAGSKFLPLAIVVTVAWALILVEGWIFFYLIRPTAPNIHLSVASAVLKIGSFGSLAVIWVAVLYILERHLLRPAS